MISIRPFCVVFFLSSSTFSNPNLTAADSAVRGLAPTLGIAFDIFYIASFNELVEIKKIKPRHAPSFPTIKPIGHGNYAKHIGCGCYLVIKSPSNSFFTNCEYLNVITSAVDNIVWWLYRKSLSYILNEMLYYDHVVDNI